MTSWLEDSTITDSLVKKGFSEQSAESRASMLRACGKVLLDPNSNLLRAWWVPGRIEVLGKHTDYAGGRSLLCATDSGVALVARPRDDAWVTIRDLRSDLHTSFDIAPNLEATAGDWTNYPHTVARRLSRNFGPLKGVDIVFKSDLPIAAGMSSSSALIVAFSIVILHTNGLPESKLYSSNIGTPEALAGYLGTVENGRTFGTLEGDTGVGTFGGSEDHTAILCSSPGRLKQYSFCPVRHERTISFPASHTFVIGSSGVVAEKTGDALELFNRASRLAAAAAGVLSASFGKPFDHLAAALLASDPCELRSALRDSSDGEFTSQDLVDRFDQFVLESEDFIPTATQALGEGDVGKFGDVVARSQDAGSRLLKNQVAQTVWLADRATQLGAIGASAFGAGFGGSVWALVDINDTPRFVDRWRSDYLSRYPAFRESAEFLITRPGPGAFEIEEDLL